MVGLSQTAFKAASGASKGGKAQGDAAGLKMQRTSNNVTVSIHHPAVVAVTAPHDL